MGDKSGLSGRVPAAFCELDYEMSIIDMKEITVQLNHDRYDLLGTRYLTVLTVIYPRTLMTDNSVLETHPIKKFLIESLDLSLLAYAICILRSLGCTRLGLRFYGASDWMLQSGLARGSPLPRGATLTDGG